MEMLGNYQAEKSGYTSNKVFQCFLFHTFHTVSRTVGEWRSDACIVIALHIAKLQLVVWKLSPWFCSHYLSFLS